jgi:hypothetical protein
MIQRPPLQPDILPACDARHAPAASEGAGPHRLGMRHERARP